MAKRIEMNDISFWPRDKAVALTAAVVSQQARPKTLSHQPAKLDLFSVATGAWTQFNTNLCFSLQ